MDYNPAVVSDILDFLFLPNYGLDLDILKVEMGGDTDSTEGAEPSHMHGGPADANYNRGYEWWLMKEAKARKPSLKLYGLPWGWPGWLDPKANATVQAKNAFANSTTTANYTLSWLLGAKHVHGLDMDYMGQWNERDAPAAYNTALRAAVAGSELASTTTVLNRLPHYPGTGTQADSKGCTQYAWNTTDGSRWVDEEGSIFDARSARCLARCVNRNYVTGCHTATFQWHLISSFYDYLPWARDGVAVANQPWSGHYEITSPTWALAHTTQFSKPGWRYTQHGNGVDLLSSGGSIVTRVSPNGQDFSIVIEKMSTDNSHCARGSNPNVLTAPEIVTLKIKGALLAAAKKNGLTVWYTNLGTNNTLGENPPDAQVFQKKDALLPVSDDGTVSLTVNVEEIYTLTTLAGAGKKGVAAKPAPPSAPFPLPFKQDFDGENISAPPAYWYDQMGAWEVQADPNKPGNKIMRQVSPVWPACWGYSCTGPMTYFGPQEFTAAGPKGFTINVQVMIEEDATFGIGLSPGFQGLLLDSKGTFTIKGDKGGSSGTADFKAGTWHNVTVSNVEGAVTATLDGKALTGSATAASSQPEERADAVTAKGGAGKYVQMSLDRYVFAAVDNFMIE